MLAESVPQPSATPIKSSMADSEDFVRLHITPLDADLITSVIPASVLPAARNISFHTIETFPEKRYGFVDLPPSEAEKLKKKFHGVTFKGSKMRIEKARPEERMEPTGKEDKPKKKKSKEDGVEKSKKRKREVDVLEGVALTDRKVKRGWTEAPAEYKKKSKKDKNSKDKEKEKRKRPKSKYTEDEECLLKMKLPLNAMKNVAPENLPVRKKKKGSSRQITVHEFEKTTKFPSFLKQTASTDAKIATEFVEGKGWVDEEGNVVEAVKQKPERPKKKKEPVPPPKPVAEEEEEDEGDDDTSSSGTSSDDTSSEEEDSDEEMSTPTPEKPTTSKQPKKAETKDESESESESETSSSGSSSEDESSPSSPQQQTTPTSSKKASPTRLAIHIPPPETPSTSKVHPLEALYKRSKPEDGATQTPASKETFSFFGGGDAEDEEDEAADVVPSIPMPMTPFTRQDLEWRTTRSAAPTPDTAHPTRMQRLWPMGTPGRDDLEEQGNEEEDEDEQEEEEEEGEEEGGKDGPAQANSDFQKWFWENRRELNRSWMSRRKSAAKEKRHRENKARASKAV